MTNSTSQPPTGDGFWYLFGIAEEIVLSSHANGALDEELVRERLLSLSIDERAQFVPAMEHVIYSADVVAEALTDDARSLRVRRKNSVETEIAGSVARTRVEQLAEEVEYKQFDDPFGTDLSEREGDIEGIIREALTLIAWHANAPGSAPKANALLDGHLRAYSRQARRQLVEAIRVLQATAALILVVLAALLDIGESGER